MGNGPVWLRSCSYRRHNSVCGERELRGERRGKGGRTWATTAASSFFVPVVGILLALPGAEPAAGQGLEVEPRVGVVVSTALYRDAAIEGLEPVKVAPGPALEGALLARTALSPMWSLEADLSYAFGALQASGSTEDRRLSDLKVVGGSVRVRRAWPRFEGVLGLGGLAYDAADARAYDEGASLFPTGIIGIAVPVRAVGRVLRIEAAARVHRHQTPVLERAGADAGLVVRGGIQLGIALGGRR